MFLAIYVHKHSFSNIYGLKIKSASSNICAKSLNIRWMKWLKLAFQRVWKTIESQGKVSEKSGNFEKDMKWQPCTLAPLTLNGSSSFLQVEMTPVKASMT